MTTRLVDAARLSRLGEIGSIPSESQRSGLQPGDRAGVLVQEGEERRTAYLHVTERKGGRYIGAPEDPADFGGQHRVAFGPSNVVVGGGMSNRKLLGGALLVAAALGWWWDRDQQSKAAPPSTGQGGATPQPQAGAAPDAFAGANLTAADLAAQKGA
jgi:hypothetical protein